ncbi:MAG: patatin-like phospholipase family protein, partial [Chitinophagales bacterium]
FLDALSKEQNNYKMAEKKIIKVLSIDGGGVRGLIPAMVLADIEQRTGKPISELFDLIAGTSTGGLLSLGMVTPDATGRPAYTAQDMVDLYSKRGNELFQRDLWGRIMSNFFDQKYDAAPLENILDEYFAETRLKDVLTDVIVTSYAIERRIPWFFKSMKAKTQKKHDYLLKDIARSTSAAPTFFEPKKVSVKDVTAFAAMIDGGIYANNPAMCAYVEAVNRFPNADEILLVSLGTGELIRPYLYSEVKDWGLASWVAPLLNMMFHGADCTVDYQLKTLLCTTNDNSQRYYRFQAKLTDETEDMDNVRPDNIEALQAITEKQILANMSEDLARLCQTLVDVETPVFMIS